jgi:hypothetical protein
MAKVTPFKPSRRDPWDARKAEHLLNRAGFGGTPEEVQAMVDLGFEGAVHRIVLYEGIRDPLTPPAWLDRPLEVNLPEGPARRRPRRRRYSRTRPHRRPARRWRRVPRASSSSALASC